MKGIPVELGGEKRLIRLTTAAFRTAELEHGVQIDLASLGSTFSFGTLAQFVWIGLLPDNPDLTELKALNWLSDLEDEGPILEQVGIAVAELVKRMNRFTEAMSQATQPDESE